MFWPTLYQALRIPQPSFPLHSIPLCGLGEVNCQRGFWTDVPSWDRSYLFHNFVWNQPCHGALNCAPALTSNSLPIFARPVGVPCQEHAREDQLSLHTCLWSGTFVPLHMTVSIVHLAPGSVASAPIGLVVRYSQVRLNIILIRREFY